MTMLIIQATLLFRWGASAAKYKQRGNTRRAAAHPAQLDDSILQENMPVHKAQNN
ncbi:MAG: hypothetical protein SOV54_05970 [Faecalibacterium prausnitzii]|nr:hypothetical protein [Faecalibacterium prausnitzii]